MGFPELFTPEYLELLPKVEAYTKQFGTQKDEKGNYIRASTYAAYRFCPFSLNREQLKLEPIPFIDKEEEKEVKAASQRNLEYGSKVHEERAERLVKEAPNAVITTKVLSKRNLVLREEVREKVAPVVQERVQQILVERPKLVITRAILEQLESKAIREDKTIDKVTKTTVAAVDQVIHTLVTKPQASAQEQDLVLLHKGVWFSGRPDSIFLRDGEIHSVDEYKTAKGLGRASYYVAQAELYCLMLFRATGQRAFNYTLSLGKTPLNLLFKRSITGEWDEEKVLRDLDNAVDYFTGKKEADFPTNFVSNRCNYCHCRLICPKQYEYEKLLQLRNQEECKRLMAHPELRKLNLPKEASCKGTFSSREAQGVV